MVKGNALIFIDANQYLNFYRAPKAKELLPLLRELENHIFVSMQIVEEVQRNKLQVAAALMADQLKKLWPHRFDVPDHLFDLTKDATVKLRKKRDDTNQRIEALCSDLVNAARQTIQRVSRSEDEVSKVLAGLFSRAVEHTRKELRQARARRERGNPPGKKTDLLGDQLTWEQLLNHCQGKSKLWIITRDTDYYTNYDSEVLLNPFLSQELARLHQSPPEVVCFDNLEKGLRNFAKAMRVRVKTLPAPEELRAIQEELDALPPLGWLSSTDANMAAIWDAQRRQRAAAFLATTTMQGWPPGEGMLLPLEAISTEEDVGRP